MKRFAAALLLFILAATCAAVAGPRDGAALYAQYCSSCHGARARGTANAPSLTATSAAYLHFMLDTGRMPAVAPDVDTLHKSPRFSDEEMDAIVGYVQSLSPGSDRSLPVVDHGDAVRGRALFAENCAHCHGATGNGASVGYDLVAPSLLHATVFQVGEAIRAGPQNMPRFGYDVLSDQDVDDIAWYVNYQETQADAPDGPNAGGLPLAHIGPVAEGLIAWLFGLGALIILVRKIGTTS